jgi:hypothetical protein
MEPWSQPLRRKWQLHAQLIGTQDKTFYPLGLLDRIEEIWPGTVLSSPYLQL